MNLRLLYFLIAATLLLLHGSTEAAEIRIAVASNFSTAMKALTEQFERETKDRVLMSSGSTGKHYAQILNGAPFDAFFAADSQRPRLLEQAGNIVARSRFTYARGRLVLWSPRPAYVDLQAKVLEDDSFRHLAIANPRLAPYGEAARQVLQDLGLWEHLTPRLVRGENIGQAFQFVRSGNAELGFVAWSQLIGAGLSDTGSFWLVPESMYSPVDQQAVQLTENAAAGSFLAFVRSAAGRQIISEHGYDLPDAD